MKTRFFSMSALAVAAIAFVGCNKIEQTVETPEKAGVPFEFIASSIDTKTTNDGLHTNWKSGDKVNLFHAVAGSTTYVAETTAFEASSDGASVTFTGTLNGGLTEDNYDWYAIYPYNSYITTPASTDAGYVTIGSAFNASQAQTGNDSKAHLAGTKYPVAGKITGVAKATKPAIPMSHLTSVIAVHVTNGTSSPITVSEISFTGTEDIVGNFYIDFTGSPVVYTPRTSYVSSTASLNVTSGSAIDPGDDATFYLAVKPFTAPASETISISVTADNGAQVRNKELASAANFVAGTINTLNFTYDKAASSLPEPSEVTGWYRVEKPAWLAAGDRVVIVNNDGTKVMKNVQKSGNRDGVAITVAADGLYKKITSFNDEAQVFILETGTVSGSFAFWCENGDNPSKYIYAASSSNNHLKSQDAKNDNASFIAALTEGVGTLTAQGTYTHKVMQFNSTLFSCYESAAYSNISVYKYYGAWTGSTTCADPTITQEGSTVTITTTTPGATIYYTTDGTNPDPTNNEQKYTHAFSIASAITVKAIAVRSHYTNSNVSSQVCTPQVATPVISGLGSSFTISCATEGATIYYEKSTTSMGSVATPTTSSTPYTAAVVIEATTYVKAIAVKDGYTNSSIASETCAYSGGGGTDYYQLVTSVASITAGTYVVGALRSTTATNNFYFGKKEVDSGDWVVSSASVTVAEAGGVREFLTTNLPAGAVEFTLTGDNTNGFTISNGTDYLYYTAASNRTLSFAAAGSSQKWTVEAKDNPLVTGGVVLCAVTGNSSNYTISENSTATGAIRGYANTTKYRAIYLFKKITK